MLTYAPGRSTTSSNSCVEVYDDSAKGDRFVANVWFPGDGKPFVSSNRSGRVDEEIILNAERAVKANQRVLL